MFSRERPKCSRRGYVYVAVLMTTLLVASLVAATLTVSTSRFVQAIDTQDHRQAIGLAHDELHRQLALSATSADWRDDQTNGTFTSWHGGATTGPEEWMAEGRGEVRYQCSDSDGDLHDDPSDPVELMFHSKVGNAEAAIAATADSVVRPLSCLGNTVSSANDLRIENQSRFVSTSTVAAGHDVVVDSDARIAAPTVHYVNALTGTVAGDVAEENVELPTVDLVAMYTDGAVAIEASSLTSFNSQKRLEQHILTSTYSPFGAAGSVYKITLNNQVLAIEDCRIEATLVVEGATKVIIRESNLVLGDPTTGVSLITDAPIEIVQWQGELVEASVGFNYNPSHAPYDGTTDSANNDVYRSELRGLFYTNDTFTVISRTDESPVNLLGCVVCHDFIVQTHTTISSMPELMSLPPEGFVKLDHLQLRPRTVRSVLSP